MSNWLQRQKNIMAQGRTGTTSKDASQYIGGVYPTHAAEASRCYLIDSDGHRYIDFIGALGAISLGYGNEKVTEAACRQARKGASFSLPHTIEVEVAEILNNLIPTGEKWRFFKNGRDTSDAAVRVARLYTKRDYIYSNGYHGSSDLWTSLTPPALGVKDEFRIRSFRDLSEINWHDAAAVIIEAIALDDSLEYQEWLKKLRHECKIHGTLFIADEIITGFRHPRWTVSNAWGLDPDIILLGKGMANGYPLSAMGGKKEVIDCGEWFFSTTFSGEAVSLAACKATIEELATKSFDDLIFYGKRLQAKLNTLIDGVHFEGYGTRCMLNVSHPNTQLLMQEACRSRILFGKAFFFNFSHLEENVEKIVMSTLEPIADKIKSGRMKLDGLPPKEVFKR